MEHHLALQSGSSRKAKKNKKNTLKQRVKIKEMVKRKKSEKERGIVPPKIVSPLDAFPRLDGDIRQTEEKEVRLGRGQQGTVRKVTLISNGLIVAE